MIPPFPEPVYDELGDNITRILFDPKSMVNRYPAEGIRNEDLQREGAIVKLVLFPLVIKMGSDTGERYDTESIVFPMHVMVTRPSEMKSSSSSRDPKREKLPRTNTARVETPKREPLQRAQTIGIAGPRDKPSGGRLEDVRYSHVLSPVPEGSPESSRASRKSGRDRDGRRIYDII